MASKNKQVKKNNHFYQAARHAIDGITFIFRTERNFRIQSLAAVLAIIAALILKVSNIEFAVIFITITLVLLSEILNTVVENLVDLLVQRQFNQTAKIIKDGASGFVLLSAILSVVVGVIILLPKIINMIGK